MEYVPHFTVSLTHLHSPMADEWKVGNMKRSLDVITATGDKIVSLWTDVYVDSTENGPG